MQSPLRYPGGKSDFAITAFEIVSKCGFAGSALIEPYAGSAAVSLNLLNSGAVSKVTLIERDPLVYSFWAALLEKTDELIERFIDLPITLKTWHSMRPLLAVEKPTKANMLELGLAGLFFNRANFSGILNAGPIGGLQQKSAYAIDCRTNKDDIICRMLSIATMAKNIEAKFGDAVSYIEKNASREDAIFYVDPPYFVKGELLYRHSYKLKEHKRLALALGKVKSPWFLSYDVHHVIEFLYEDFHVRKLKFQYSARSPKNHDELLVSNFLIPFEPVVASIQRA
ncbi:MAG: DNA adenine methylase [Polaromonas sp.]